MLWSRHTVASIKNDTIICRGELNKAHVFEIFAMKVTTKIGHWH